MSECPSQDLLLRLLDEQLADTERAEIVNHVELCAPCQKRLELTRGHGSASIVPELLGPRSPEGGTITQPAGQLDTNATTVVEGCPDNWGTIVGQAAHDKRSTQANSEPVCDDPYRTKPASVISEVPGLADSRTHTVDGRDLPGYEILGTLGHGGMGVVYRARHIDLNRLVALKMILGGSHSRPDLVARFRIEAQTVARLRHPNIVQIYDIGEADGLPFVSLELLECGSLADRLAGTPQPARRSAELMITLAEAIDTAHHAGIVHRDLKPNNVLFAADGTLKVTDFGLAKRLEGDSRQTQSGQIMGTPSYMAPEQARGRSRDVGPAADVYALGAILYEMLTGRPPLKGETPIETVRQVIDDDPVPPSRLVPRVARDLETICLKCLNKEMHKRYESAQAFAEDLRRYLRGEPIKARRTPFWERGAKWARRRPLAAVAAALAPLVIVGSFIAALRYQRVQADSRLRESDRAIKGYDVLLAARKSLEQNQLTDAKATLKGLQGEFATESAAKLTDLNRQAGLLLGQIEERLADQKERAADHARYERFLRSLNEAHFHDTQFNGLELAANQAATRQAALTALAVCAAPGAKGPWTLGRLPESLTASQQAQIKDGCYELLLAVADAVDRPDESLRLLDQATHLRAPTVAYYLRRAEYLARAGDAAAAKQAADLANSARPTTALDYFLMGQEQYKRGNPAAANRRFERALQIQASHFWARCLSSICHLRLGQPAVAKVGLTVCIDREPEYAWLYVYRGFASYQLTAMGGEQRQDRSLEAEKKTQDEAADNFEQSRSDYERALELLKSKPDNDLRWVLLVNRGALFLKHEDWAKAADDFLEATHVNDRRPEAFVGLARVYQKQGHFEQAIEQFTSAIATKSGSPPLYRGRAEVNLARAELTPVQRKSALLDLDQAIRLEPKDNPIVALDQTRRATLLRQDRREIEALAACEFALQVGPNYREAHLLRIQVLLDLNRYDEVTRSCDALLADDRTWAALHELRGLARTGLKDFAGAIEDDTQAIALEPTRAQLYVRRGNLHLVSDAPKLAVHDFDEAVLLVPTDGDALSGRGAARVRLGRYREAVADTEKALRIGDQTAQRLYTAARTYARAAAVASGDVRKRGQDTVRVVGAFLDRGTVLLRTAINKLPTSERAAFWRDVVQADPDPAMSAVRRRLRFRDEGATSGGPDR